VGCLLHASRQGRFQVLELLCTVLYGFLLEWLTIKQLSAYHYGQFLVMIDGAPLAVALGWAVIIYSCMGFTSRLRLAEPARPILDALLALNIDVALDVVAVRLGMWAWHGVELDQQWFGVPWANFLAWFIIVWSFSGSIRALRAWQEHRWRRWLYPLLAIALSLLVLTGSSSLYRFVPEQAGKSALVPLLLIAGSLVIVVDVRPGFAAEPQEPMIALVPIAFHAFALVAGVASGIFARNSTLAFIAVAMLLVGLGLHALPWWAARSRRQSLQT
jgi:hypothetical protein